MSSTSQQFPGDAGGRGGSTPPTGEADVHAEVAEEVSDEMLEEQARQTSPTRSPQRWRPTVPPRRQAVANGEVPAAPTDPTGSASDAEALQSAAELLAAERLADLQRLQAEYVNYRRRVERDRSVARDSAVASVLEGLLGVLDDIELARQHGDLESGPFSAIAEKLESSARPVRPVALRGCR